MVQWVNVRVNMILYSALGDMFAHLELKRRESNERKAVLTTISVEQHSLFYVHL